MPQPRKPGRSESIELSETSSGTYPAVSGGTGQPGNLGRSDTSELSETSSGTYPAVSGGTYPAVSGGTGQPGNLGRSDTSELSETSSGTYPAVSGGGGPSVLPEWLLMPKLRELRASLPSQIQFPCLKPSAYSPNLYLLCENLQVSGSYKVRAACHLVQTWQKHHQSQHPRGVALASSGNFASAIAWAGRQLGVPTGVVMMEKSSAFKANKASSLGAELFRCGNHTNDRIATLQGLAKDGWWCVDHMESQEVIQAHATLGLDLVDGCLSQNLVPNRVLVPVSTAGLLAGVAAAVKQQFPNTKVIGLQSSTSQAAVQSFRARQVVQLEQTQTICDALTANRPGRLPMEICWDWVDQLETVDDELTQQSVLELLQQEHLLVEPGAAIGHAYLKLHHQATDSNDVLVLSGGNLDPQLLSRWIAE
jgi:threonine dehydratase